MLNEAGLWSIVSFIIVMLFIIVVLELIVTADTAVVMSQFRQAIRMHESVREIGDSSRYHHERSSAVTSICT